MISLDLCVSEEYFDYQIKKEIPYGGGIHYIFRFPNELGASVVKSMISYGHEWDLWELRVIEHPDTKNWTPFDAVGFLTNSEVEFQLKTILEIEVL